MHSDPLDNPRLAALFEELRTEYGSVPVRPDPRVAALFTADAPATAGSFIAIHPVRRRPMVSDMLKSLPGKVAAGFVGATLAWSGLGIAGAVPGPLSLAADDTELACPAEDDGTTTDDGTAGDETTTADGTTTADEGTTEECVAEDDGSADDGTTEDDSADDDATADDDADDDDADDADADDSADDDADDTGELPAVPTRVSEAAHIHDFDDECGNHGKYVSHFARTGTEPECATAAREAAAGEDGGDEDDGAVETESVDAKAEKKAAKDEAKDEKRSGKGKGGKGKGGKGKRR